MHVPVIRRWPPYAAALLCVSAALACNLQLGGGLSTESGRGTPSVVFLAPAVNTVIAEGAAVVLAVQVTDAQGGPSAVEFLVDDASVGTQQVTPATPLTVRHTWQARGARGHLLSAVAKRADGSIIGTAEITLQVVIATFAPISVAANVTPTLVVATQAASVTSSPLPGGRPQITATTNLNIRRGPGTNYDIIDALKPGDSATIVGRNNDRRWWVIERGSVRGWVTSDTQYSTVSGDTSQVPLAASPPSPVPSPTVASTLAPTSTPAQYADLIIDSVTIAPPSPTANQTFFVYVTVRNQGTVDARPTLLSGLFQPGNELSEIAVPAIPAGQQVQLPALPVTLKQAGANQVGALTLDARNELNEGPNGEANNVRTINYNVN
jgi:uncharacterized protein YraI